MTNLLLKIFVKNSQNTSDSAVKDSVGKMSGWVCIVLNLLLSAAKITVGAIFGALSVLADGLNNLTDCGSNLVSIIGIKLAAKPADNDHPFGHRRMEYVVELIVSFVVLALAFELAFQSVSQIISAVRGEASEVSFGLWIFLSLAVSVAVKFWMFVFNKKLAKRYSYELLNATATDSLSDVLSSAAVLLALVISHFGGINLDGLMGAVVSVLIAVGGIKIFCNTVNELLGEAPSDEMTKQIVTRVKSFDGVLGVHDLNVHNYGPDKFYATVHVEVDSSVDLLTSHDLMDRIERDFAENTDIKLVTHLDPVVVGDSETDLFRAEVLKIVKQLDRHFEIHDFRMTKGPTHTNLIFDVAVHFDTELTNRQITEYIQAEISQIHPEVYVVPTVERQLKDDEVAQ